MWTGPSALLLALGAETLVAAPAPYFQMALAVASSFMTRMLMLGHSFGWLDGKQRAR